MSLLNSIRQIIPGISRILNSDSCPTTSQDQPPFTPTYASICQARILLKSLNLPTELVLAILEYAEYWVQVSFSTSDNTRPSIANAGGGRATAAAMCLSADIYNAPLVREMGSSGGGGETVKLKKMEFRIQSRDQGWTSEGGQGGFATSSWVEVSILRRMAQACGEEERRGPETETGTGTIQSEDGPSEDEHLEDESSEDGYSEDGYSSDERSENGYWDGPQVYNDFVAKDGWQLVQRPGEAHYGPQWGEGGYAWYLQGNRVSAESEMYRVVWGRGGSSEGNEGKGDGEGFLEELRMGDKVVVWARARYPGWQCIVESVDVLVYFGF